MLCSNKPNMQENQCSGAHGENMQIQFVKYKSWNMKPKRKMINPLDWASPQLLH